MKGKPPIKDDYRRSLLYVASRTNIQEAKVTVLLFVGFLVILYLHSCFFSAEDNSPPVPAHSFDTAP